jgi:hypothetical protein
MPVACALKLYYFARPNQSAIRVPLSLRTPCTCKTNYLRILMLFNIFLHFRRSFVCANKAPLSSQAVKATAWCDMYSFYSLVGGVFREHALVTRSGWCV